MAGPSKGPDRHRRKVTPHPASSLGHPLPVERERAHARASALKNGSSLSEGRGWTAPRAFTSGRGTGEGSLAWLTIEWSHRCQTLAASPAEPEDYLSDPCVNPTSPTTADTSPGSSSRETQSSSRATVPRPGKGTHARRCPPGYGRVES